MQTMVELIQTVVGVAPEGYEYIEYIAAVCLAIFFFRSVIGLFGLVLKALNPK